MQELKVLAGNIYDTNLVWKILSESATIRRTAKKCHNQKNIKKVQQSEAFPRLLDVSQSKVLPGSSVIMGSVRQYYKKCIQGVLQLKVHQGSVAIKSTAMECHNLST